MSTTYRTEEADLDISHHAIKALWAANLKGHNPESVRAKLDLGYLHNPAGLGTALMLYPVGDDSPKGVQGLHPRVFHFGDRRIRAAGLADYTVDAAHRSLGPALMLMRHGVALCKERFELTYGLPNHKAASVFARAGLSRFGVVRRYAKPLATHGRLAGCMPAWLARRSATLLDLALAAHDRLRALSTHARLECADAAWDDPSFDVLWAQRPRGLLLSERSGRMLRWRYASRAGANWRVCIARDRVGTAHGYLVWRINQEFLEVGDFFSTDPLVRTTALMLAFARFARPLGASSMSVAFFGSSRIVERLKASGLRMRPQETPLFVMPGMPACLEGPELWYFSGFDDDED